jgi:hypothetical protein
MPCAAETVIFHVLKGLIFFKNCVRFQNYSRSRHEYESVVLKGRSTGEMAKSSKELSDTCLFFFLVNILVRMKVDNRCRLHMKLPAM